MSALTETTRKNTKEKTTKSARKTKSTSSIVPTKKAVDPIAITPVEYGGLQAAFDYLNTKLFSGKLPNVFITYQRRSHSGGYFSPDRFTSRAGDTAHHEIALNPDGSLARPTSTSSRSCCTRCVTNGNRLSASRRRAAITTRNGRRRWRRWA